MAIDLVTKFSNKVDETFTTESKASLLTNKDYDWSGAHTVKVYKITTAPMNDYDRDGTKQHVVTEGKAQLSRYGLLAGLDATTQTMTLRKDRSFTFAIDKLDADETVQALQAGTALARQQREVLIPEIDSYVINQMATNAGHTPMAKELTTVNIYDEIMAANAELDNAEAPEVGRVLVVSPDVYLLLKKNKDFLQATDIAQDVRFRGVIAMVDGIAVMRVPANRLPVKCGFLLAHPVATVHPVKLSEFKIHNDPPFISGDLVEGRVVYDAFILDNKKDAIYYQATT